MHGGRVLVAMSGGVDSSVAAARLRDAGHDVVGVTLHLWDYPEDPSARGRCCAPEDQHDARRVADALGIPHYTFDRRQLFREQVVDPFVGAYLEGQTPSPCVDCNRTVKIRELLAIADRLGARHIATGHYARVGVEDGTPRLYRGRDGHKDQSYFLHMLDESVLERLLLPLGESTKEEVRAEALARALPGATKGESQELCFVGSGSYGEFVGERAAGRVRPGAIVDAEGRVLGAHDGVHRYTVGQRKGLGVAVGSRAFVVGIDAPTGTVRLGDEHALLARAARLRDPSFRRDVAWPVRADVRVRARHQGAPATVGFERDEVTGTQVLVARFDEPVRAVAPGQVAVAYSGERVLGGATIVQAMA
ncbi:MAG: tRNA 2-thiouridine(34) synthase MnmA [Polyangiaceae bacterium]